MSTRKILALACVIMSLATSAACRAPGGPAAAPASPASAAQEPAGPALDLSSGDEEFGEASALSGWAMIQGDSLDGTANQVEVDAADPGVLRVKSARLNWVNRSRGFYLYREVTGDFMATARVRALGTAAGVPTIDWSLTGLLVRAPRGSTPAENWIGYTAGYVSGAVTESKTTLNGTSTLKLHQIQPGWIDLRVVRVGAMFVCLRRQGGEWVLDAAYLRPDLPATVQIGVNAGSGTESERADLIAEADWIRFAAHTIPSATQAEVISAAAISTERINRLMVRDTDRQRIRDLWWSYLTK